MKAKKHLGQNFLKSAPALKKIVGAGEIKKSDTVLEIGPGKGVLTEKLLETGAKVIAVEKDWELYELLKEKFSESVKSGSLTLAHGSIMDFDPDELGRYKIVANIPYNLTGAILRKFLSAGGGSAFGGKKFLTAKNQPERMVLMIQKEVAERIIGRPRHKGGVKKESLLSISVKAYGTPKMIMKVEKRYFFPAPKVDSAVIAITGISREFFRKNKIGEEKFWEIVKLGFAHKRKKLSGNLKKLAFGEKTVKNSFLTPILVKRAEDLTLFEWIALTKL